MAKIKLGERRKRIYGRGEQRKVVHEQEVEIIAETPYEKGLLTRLYLNETVIGIRDTNIGDGKWETALIIRYWRKAHCPNCLQRVDR